MTRSSSSWSSVSTPSATTLIPSAWAMPTIARTIVVPGPPASSSAMNERSIFTLSIGKRRS